MATTAQQLVAFVERQNRVRRLLRIAKDLTINPAVIRKIKRKLDQKGEESLSPKELKILKQLDRNNEVRQKGADKAVEGIPQGGTEGTVPESETEWEEDAEGKPTGKDIWRRFVEPHVWADVPDDKKPMMLKHMSDHAHDKKVDPDASKRSKQELGKDFVEKGDHGGATRLASRKLLLKIKNIRRLSSDSLDRLKSSDKPAERAAAKELQTIIPQALAPLEQSEELLKRIDPVLEEITPQNARGKLKIADQAITEGLMGFRTWGSQLKEVFSEVRGKNVQAAQNLKRVAGQRFKEAMKQLRAQGMEPGEAAAKAKQTPALRKMMMFIQGAEAKVEAYDFVLNEMAAVYDGSRTIMKQLQNEFKALEASLSMEREASGVKISKRLRKVSKRLILLRYLSNTSQESLRDSGNSTMVSAP